MRIITNILNHPGTVAITGKNQKFTDMSIKFITKDTKNSMDIIAITTIVMKNSAITTPGGMNRTIKDHKKVTITIQKRIDFIKSQKPIPIRMLLIADTDQIIITPTGEKNITEMKKLSGYLEDN